jgi:hypothetical protein
MTDLLAMDPDDNSYIVVITSKGVCTNAIAVRRDPAGIAG